jgi:hypothetical protein
MENEKIITTLESIAKYQQETTISLVRMEGKQDKMEIALTAKVDAHKISQDTQIGELTRDIRELERWKEKHEDEHKLDHKERTKFVWSLVVTAIVAVGGWVIPYLG